MMRYYSALLIILVSFWMACSRSSTVTTSEGKVTVSKTGEGAKVKIESEAGEKAHIEVGESGVSLPKDLPADMPIYPGSSVVSSATLGENARLVSLKTNDGVEKVMDFYDAKLKDNGWEIQTRVSTQQGNLLQAKKEARHLTVGITRQDKDTMINLTSATMDR
ncbi:MAG: hypothetical protein HY314_06140 [Acidobacteria bacterium]|nr:hypothetical protein [Acidobacteriota bacterium]